MVEICDILSNEKMTENYDIYSMIIAAPRISNAVKPGQIVHIKCGEFTLRRPLSVASAKNGTLRLCYDVRGEGTEWLSKQQKGGKIDILGPMGNGFDVFDVSKKVLLVGGGIGIYPLYMLAELFKANATVVLGFRTEGLITMQKDFEETGCKLIICTDDGSYIRGKKGYAIEAVREILDNQNIDIIMMCGPKIMMKGIAEEAVKRGIRCQASMEERMACGVGACLACVCKIKDGGDNKFENKRICVDGPVFDICVENGKEIDWE